MDSPFSGSSNACELHLLPRRRSLLSLTVPSFDYLSASQPLRSPTLSLSSRSSRAGSCSFSDASTSCSCVLDASSPRSLSHHQSLIYFEHTQLTSSISLSLSSFLFLLRTGLLRSDPQNDPPDLRLRSSHPHHLFLFIFLRQREVPLFASPTDQRIEVQVLPQRRPGRGKESRGEDQVC